MIVPIEPPSCPFCNSNTPPEKLPHGFWFCTVCSRTFHPDRIRRPLSEPT